MCLKSCLGNRRPAADLVEKSGCDGAAAGGLEEVLAAAARHPGLHQELLRRGLYEVRKERLHSEIAR